MIRVGIIGITGYTGEELLRILSHHKDVKITVLAGRAESEIRNLKDIYPKYADLNLKCYPLNIEQMKKETDVVFLALSHAVAFEVVPDLIKADIKVIDLSADFRIKNPDTYEKWYGVKHTGKEFIRDAVYGLVELNRDKIKSAKLIANPGCYPTTVLLGSAPAIKNCLVKCLNSFESIVKVSLKIFLILNSVSFSFPKLFFNSSNSLSFKFILSKIIN